MDFNKLINGLSRHTEIEWWKMLIIGIVFLAVNFGVFLFICMADEAAVEEYGYPKRKSRHMKRKKANYTIWQRLFMIRLVVEAERQGPFLYLILFTHFLHIFSMIGCIVGFVGCMITLSVAWAELLLTCSVGGMLIFTILLTMIPSIVCLPSINIWFKNRYSIRKK